MFEVVNERLQPSKGHLKGLSPENKISLVGIFLTI